MKSPVVPIQPERGIVNSAALAGGKSTENHCPEDLIAVAVLVPLSAPVVVAAPKLWPPSVTPLRAANPGARSSWTIPVLARAGARNSARRAERRALVDQDDAEGPVFGQGGPGREAGRS